MSWVTIIWSMAASASLTLAAMHLLVWCRKRAAWVNLLFALTAIATAGVAACELWMMHSETPREFGTALRWLHVPGWLVVVSLVGFVWVYLRSGRLWLAWAACVLRTLSLILDFLFTPNLNYREITTVRHIRYLGESVSVSEGVLNPWMLISQAGLALLVVFTVDATITAWRRGSRRPALWLGGAIVFFTLASTVQIVLVIWEVARTPLTPSLFFLGIVAVMGYELSRDVLRAAQLSAELRESEERMTLAAEAAGFGVWMWSIPGNHIWGSERWLRLFGFVPGAAVTFEEVIQRIHPDDRELVEREVRYAVEQRVVYAGEFRVILPDGTQRWIAARGRMGPDTLGNPARMLGAAIDITDRKQSELRIEAQRNELAHLSRATLLGELGGSLAHELNQPLTAMVNNAAAGRRFIAKGHTDPQKLDALLEAVVVDGRRAGDILRGIRDMIRKDEDVRKPLDLNAALAEILRLVRPDALGRHCTLVREFDSGLGAVNANRVQLQQVFLNLIMNAMEAMDLKPAETRRIIVRTERPAEGEVRVSVRDFGDGLPPGEPEKVFAPFFSMKRSGMGLGLTIARSIVEAHGGRITAANAEGGGACFSFSLPTLPEDGATVPDSPRSGGGPAA